MPEILMTEKSRSMIRGNGNQPLDSCSPVADSPPHYYLANLPVDTRGHEKSLQRGSAVELR